MRPQIPTIRVRYIGPRPYWRDNLYDSGLDFEQGQERDVPDHIARSFLRHHDTFEAVTDATKSSVPQHEVADDTAALLEQAQHEKAVEEHRIEDQNLLTDSIERLDKAGLLEFAHTNYRQTLNRSDSVSALREQCRGLVRRFGVTGAAP
jgi:hypothetical protein